VGDLLEARQPAGVRATGTLHPVDIKNIINDIKYVLTNAFTVITSRQLRAARALAGIDQRALAKASRLSLPTIQRMEASDGVIRGNVESLMKLIAALDRLGIDLINEGAASEGGGRGLRLKKRS
jgi:Helix-turn-helix